MKTETEATTDNERIMRRFYTLQRDATAASAETIRLAAAAAADPAAYRAMWRAYNEATAAGEEVGELFDSLFEVYRGYFDAAAVRGKSTEFGEERRVWRKIMACYDLDAVGAMAEIIRINGKINEAADAMSSVDPRV
jgi:hypothetical protein